MVSVNCGGTINKSPPSLKEICSCVEVFQESSLRPLDMPKKFLKTALRWSICKLLFSG